jgi:hypothetical protein
MLTKTFYIGNAQEAGSRIFVELKFDLIKKEFVILRTTKDSQVHETVQLSVSDFFISANEEEQAAFLTLASVALDG